MTSDFLEQSKGFSTFPSVTAMFILHLFIYCDQAREKKLFRKEINVSTLHSEMYKNISKTVNSARIAFHKLISSVTELGSKITGPGKSLQANLV